MVVSVSEKKSNESVLKPIGLSTVSDTLGEMASERCRQESVEKT